MLNSEQKKAVECVNGPLLMLAGAGAGKTHTLTQRVAYMIKEKNIAPGSILCVTFTNKAAREMKERIGKNLDREIEGINFYKTRDFPLIGTFHSIGVYFLRLFINRIGYDKNFSILDEDDKMKIVRGIIDDLGRDTKETQPRQVAWAISNAKNNGQKADRFANNTKNYFDKKVAEVYEIYEKTLKNMNSLDFDDILLHTLAILDNSDVLEYLHNRFEYFLVDEYQDTNETQYQIMKKLASKHTNICVVGDDWQGIYSWRGANIANIFNFKKDYTNATIIKLEQNYRSTKNIIEAANNVVKNNANILDKTLWTDNIIGEKIKIFSTFDERHEAEMIAKRIGELQEADFENTNAVLYRTNGQSRLIEEALINAGIPYRVFGGVKFYERKEIKDILAYLRLIANRYDIVSFNRIVNVPARKIGPKSISIFSKYIQNNNYSPIDGLDKLAEIEELPPLARKGLENFKNIYSSITTKIDSLSLPELLQEIITSINYEGYLLDEYGNEEYEARMENVIEFKNMASRYLGMDTRESLLMFLEEIALITDADIDNEKNTQNRVALMTIHLAKGLEFDNVFIAGLEEGIFPHSRSTQEVKELEEERRLMYVAMTRAKKDLFITKASERFHFGSYSANPQSRFIREIPKELKVEEFFIKNNFSFGKNYSSSSYSFTPSENTYSAPKKEIIKNDPKSFSMGDKIEHPKFGIGTIISLDGDNASIAFAGAGIKKMNILIAPVKKI